MSVLTHKVRIVVRTRRQRDALTLPLVVSQQLYNAALEERSSAWSKSKTRIGYNDQMKSITALAGDPSLAGLPSTDPADRHPRQETPDDDHAGTVARLRREAAARGAHQPGRPARLPRLRRSAAGR